METAVVFIPVPAWEIALKIQKSGPIPIQLLLDGIQFLNIFNIIDTHDFLTGEDILLTRETYLGTMNIPLIFFFKWMRYLGWV